MVSDNIIIRQLKEADVPYMTDLHMRAVRHSYTGHYPEHVVKDWADSRAALNYFTAQDEGYRFLVASLHDRPVGFIGWKDGELRGLYIDPNYHDQRIGSRLVRAADAQANIPITFVNSALPARGFYEKMGFIETKLATDTVCGHTIDCVHMHR